MMVGSDFVFVDLPAKRIAVNAENVRGTRLIAVGAIQDTLDEALLKFLDRLLKQNAPVHHLVDKPIQLVFQGCTLRSRS